MAQGKTTRGTKQSVACPHCNFMLNFVDAPLVEVGSMFSCDRCKGMVQIVRLQTVEVVYLTGAAKRVRGLQKT